MFGQKDFHKDSRLHEHNYRHDAYGHTHGAIDPAILTTQRGIWAVKWSFLGLLATAIFQVVIVFVSGSVALLADTIHNFGDASTAIPLWFAFTLAKWPP
ncbi:MAG: czcD, partial [Candidatus Brocadiaceae bacterium]|nr:czcD [Candidatus Brocadiaceae bacterium]